MEAFKIKLPSWIAEKANDYVDLGHILHIEAQEFFWRGTLAHEQVSQFSL